MDREPQATEPDAFAFPDSFPLPEGHTLVIPQIHEARLFNLDAATRSLVWELVDTVQAHLVETLAPDGFNIGVNVRPAQERLARG